MPQFCVGDMWSVYDEVDLFLITTNSTLKRNGALVMGRGIARQARDRFAGKSTERSSGLDMALGQEIAAQCGNLGEYGLLVSPRWPAAKLGAFQVKTHYSRPAQLPLIHRSTLALITWCERHPQAIVCLNFPGIGNGGLTREAVLPIIARLPDRVQVWEYAESAGRKSR